MDKIKAKHRATVEKIEATNSQLFHQMREETTTQLNELKGRITYFLGDVLTHLIPTKGEEAPSDYRKATVIKEKAWIHLGLAIDISHIKEQLRKNGNQKTTSG